MNNKDINTIKSYIITLHNIYYTNIYIGKIWVYKRFIKGYKCLK